MNAAILASVEPGLAGIGSGVLNASRQIGTALGVAVFASLFHDHAKAAAVRVSLFWAAALYLTALVLAARASKPAAVGARGAAIADVAAIH